MNRRILVLFAFTLSVASCAVFQSKPAQNASVTYTQHIEPIIKAKCTPCHYPETGKADMLNTYDLVRSHIGGIIYRVQLDPENKRYMPYKQKKEALTADEIALLQQWKAEGFGK